MFQCKTDRPPPPLADCRVQCGCGRPEGWVLVRSMTVNPVCCSSHRRRASSSLIHSPSLVGIGCSKYLFHRVQ